MMKFVKKANLPDGKVTRVICGELCAELNNYLDSRGIERIVIEENKYIDPAVKLHADMAAIHLGDNRIVADKKQRSLIKALREHNFDVVETTEEIKGEYPADVALNFSVIGDKALGNFKYADKALYEQLTHFELINVKQGYCKCSCLVVNNNALITDDKSIYDNALKNGIDCLLISKGDIHLDGHDYGFIGGSSAKISADEILFFGDVTKHRDYKKITGFLSKHGCKAIYLSFPLTDFGGLITINEQAP